MGEAAADYVAEGATTGTWSGEPFTRSFNSLLGLKKGIFLAGTSTRSPVLGLRPTRGLRCRVRKLPNPRISILSPARSERTTLSKMVSTITSLSLRVNSAKREISSIKSALVIACALPYFLLNSGRKPRPRDGVCITFSNFRGCWQEACYQEEGSSPA